ncbi:hypothetical protein [Pseudocitrobacter vendiensis]|uniref:Secreted protein n=1 Tax=Pseudocitrobacter vendiensis TaxID=2488306 RepID=A0ABN8T984_9ENTR|nr:hypothetical protein [Pseudocitrobacter vendiensis]CAH6635954.1 Secreted protein [Pseudocitrobacter vendiensis]
MRSKIKYGAFITGCCLYCFGVHGQPINITTDEVKNMSLKECLDINYRKLGLYDGNGPGVKDKSYLLKWYAIDNDSTKKSKELKNFIRREAGGYYRAKPPLKEINNVNMVFELCMHFYKSDKLNRFIVGNIMK